MSWLPQRVPVDSANGYKSVRDRMRAFEPKENSASNKSATEPRSPQRPLKKVRIEECPVNNSPIVAPNDSARESVDVFSLPDSVVASPKVDSVEVAPIPALPEAPESPKNVKSQDILMNSTPLISSPEQSDPVPQAEPVSVTAHPSLASLKEVAMDLDPMANASSHDVRGRVSLAFRQISRKKSLLPPTASLVVNAVPSAGRALPPPLPKATPPPLPAAPAAGMSQMQMANTATTMIPLKPIFTSTLNPSPTFGSIWLRQPPLALPLEAEQMLVKLFEPKPMSAAAIAVAGMGSAATVQGGHSAQAPGTLRVLDPRRSRNLEISLRQFKSPQHLLETLEAAKLETLSAEAVSLLLREYPSDELQMKMEKLETEWPEAEWEVPEQYLLAMVMATSSEISDGKLLLETWLYALTGVAAAEAIIQQLATAQSVCEALLSCGTLQEVMRVMLAVANRLNCGTHRGEAAGLMVESLGVFEELKGEGGVSGLGVVVKIWQKAIAPQTAATSSIARMAKNAAPAHTAVASSSSLSPATVEAVAVSNDIAPVSKVKAAIGLFGASKGTASSGGFVGSRVAALRQVGASAAPPAPAAVPEVPAVSAVSIPTAPVTSGVPADLSVLAQCLASVERGVGSLSELEAEVSRLMEMKAKVKDADVKLGGLGEAWKICEEAKKAGKKAEEAQVKVQEVKKTWDKVVEMYGVRGGNSKEFFEVVNKLVKQLGKYMH